MPSYRHFPAFAELCDIAKHAELQVRLVVSEDRLEFAQRRGEEYRQFACIEIWTMRFGSVVERAAIFDDDLEAAAQDLLARAA